MVNDHLKSEIARLEGEIGQVSTVVSGDTEQSDDAFLSLADKVALIRANVISCSIDSICNNVFQDKGYTCPVTLAPTCVDKFCECT